MFISKHKSGIYYIWYVDERGKKKVSTFTKRKSEAIRVLAEFRVIAPPKQPVIRLSGFINEFMAFARSTFTHDTTEIFRRTLGQFLAAAGDIPLQNITARQLD